MNTLYSFSMLGVLNSIMENVSFTHVRYFLMLIIRLLELSSDYTSVFLLDLLDILYVFSMNLFVL